LRIHSDLFTSNVTEEITDILLREISRLNPTGIAIESQVQIPKLKKTFPEAIIFQHSYLATLIILQMSLSDCSMAGIPRG